MGTCCSSFSTLVAVTYTSPAFTASSARAKGGGSSAQARITAEKPAHVIVFFIFPILSSRFSGTAVPEHLVTSVRRTPSSVYDRLSAPSADRTPSAANASEKAPFEATSPNRGRSALPYRQTALRPHLFVSLSSVCLRKSCMSWERFTCQNWPARVSTTTSPRSSTSPARLHCSRSGRNAERISTP